MSATVSPAVDLVSAPRTTPSLRQKKKMRERERERRRGSDRPSVSAAKTFRKRKKKNTHLVHDPADRRSRGPRLERLQSLLLQPRVSLAQVEVEAVRLLLAHQATRRRHDLSLPQSAYPSPSTTNTARISKKTQNLDRLRSSPGQTVQLVARADRADRNRSARQQMQVVCLGPCRGLLLELYLDLLPPAMMM